MLFETKGPGRLEKETLLDELLNSPTRLPVSKFNDYERVTNSDRKSLNWNFVCLFLSNKLIQPILHDTFITFRLYDHSDWNGNTYRACGSWLRLVGAGES